MQVQITPDSTLHFLNNTNANLPSVTPIMVLEICKPHTDRDALLYVHCFVMMLVITRTALVNNRIIMLNEDREKDRGEEKRKIVSRSKYIWTWPYVF